MKIVHAISVFGLLFPGALSLSKNSQPNTISIPVGTVHIAKDSASNMWTDQSTVFSGETLQLHFEVPHELYLGVIDPKGHFFYVVFPAENGVGKLQPLVPSEQFTTLKTLTINTLTFKADPYTYGVLENQPVFTQSGTYRFLLGDNLHVDDEDFLTVLKINYIKAVRP